MSAAQLRREDEQARKLARTDFTRPLVLEAGAGTGKTASLVARVAVWCLTGGWAKARSALGADPADARVAERVLERVAMITFTEKAAVEMEQRIGAAFREVLAGKQVPGLPIAELELERETLVGRTTELVAALDRLQVRTIHGFCSTLLSRHALAAGLHPAFDVDADGSVVRRICAEVVSEALPVALGPTPDPHWLVLLRSERGPNDVLEALQTLVVQGVSPAGLRCDPYPAEEVEAFVALLATPVGELVETLRAVLPEVDAMVGEGLITLEHVEVIAYRSPEKDAES